MPLESSMNIMSAAAFQLVFPEEYHRKHLENRLRVDGREFLEGREYKVTVHEGKESLSIVVQLGETLVMAGIKAQVSSPHMDTPNSGYLVINVDAPSFLQTQFHCPSSSPAKKATFISGIMSELYSKINLVPLEQLCIMNGKAVWTLYIDVVCLHDDGNLLGASVLATSLALKKLKLPDVVYDDDIGSVTAVSTPKNLLLQMQRSFAVTFKILEMNSIVLLDPTKSEESLPGVEFAIILNECGEILYLSKSFSDTMQFSTLKSCIELAKGQLKLMNII